MSMSMLLDEEALIESASGIHGRDEQSDEADNLPQSMAPMQLGDALEYK